MGIVIDSSVLIEWERASLDLRARISQGPSEACLLSVITASELLHGVHRARDPRRRARRVAYVEGALAALPVIPIDLAAARIHSRLWAGLQAEGMVVGMHDLWIAAQCLAHGHRLATADVRHFGRVPDLAVEHWAKLFPGSENPADS